MSEILIKAVVATAQVMGTELSEDAARMFCQDLSDYHEPSVLEALTRCRREVKGKLTLADVVARIDDGRPGPNEAWAMIPKSEADTVVWSDEMRSAYAAASPLMHDEVAARMAFIETYQREVTKARAEKRPPKWTPSLGWDATGREHVLRNAVEKGRLTVKHALVLLPNGTFEEMEKLPRLGDWHISKLLKDETTA